MDCIDDLSRDLKQFAEERNWEQFHDAKNLSMALIAETAELVEHFQWLSAEQSMSLSAEKKQQVAHEMADVLIYLIRMAERLNIDLIDAANQKMAINRQRFPVEKVSGRAVRGRDMGK